jgi:hypothetical protein
MTGPQKITLGEMRAMGIRGLLLTAALIVVLNPSAFAGYIENYAGWRGLNEGQKLGYVMGAYDLGLATVSDNDPYDEPDKRGIRSCSMQSSLNSAMLVQLVETNYAQNPDSWTLPPSVVLRKGIFAMCKTYINDFRSAKGLNLLK